ncbi:MAG: peptidase M48, partial [Myxococcota bacterium]
MATDFFELQDDARRNTGRLILLFVLAVIAICVSLYALAVVVSGYQGQDSYTGDPQFELLWWNPELLAQVSFATLLVVGG